MVRQALHGVRCFDARARTGWILARGAIGRTFVEGINSTNDNILSGTPFPRARRADESGAR
jgi:hypothetical protein